MRISHGAIDRPIHKDGRPQLLLVGRLPGTAVLDLGEIMICGLDFPKYFLINSLITRSNF